MEYMPEMLAKAFVYYVRKNGIKTFNILDADQPVITIRFNRKKLQEAMAAAASELGAGSTCTAPSSETFHSSTTTRMARNKKRCDDYKTHKKHNTRASSKRNANDMELPRISGDQIESYGFSNLSPEAAVFQPRDYPSPPVDTGSPGISSMPVSGYHDTAEPNTMPPLIEETGTMVTHDIPPLKTSSEASCDDSSDFGSTVLDLFSSVGTHSHSVLPDGSSAPSFSDSYDSDSQISESHQSFYKPVVQEKSDLYHSCLSLEVPWSNWIHVPHQDSYAVFTRELLFVDGMTCAYCGKHPAKRDIHSWDRFGNYTWNYYCSTFCRNEWNHNCRLDAEVV